jgi:hypothetical protein
MQGGHYQLQWTQALLMVVEATEECAEIAPDKYTMCTNLLFILYHYNTKV